MRILLVEDDLSLLNAMAFALQSVGHVTETALGGKEALDILRSGAAGRNPLEILITDLRMPGMNGLDLIREAHRHQPELQAVIVTAYMSEIRDRCGQTPLLAACLEKPVALSDLTRVIESLQEPREPDSPPAGALRSELIAQWHPTRNGGLNPAALSPRSHKRVWWICGQGHEWQASLDNRSRGNDCPYCRGRLPTREQSLQAVNPALARQWHPERNGSLRPEDVRPNSARKVWWVCEQGHKWRAGIQSRNRGSGCPFCSGLQTTPERNLAALNPELARQWHPFRNGRRQPDALAPNSNRKVWWLCAQGHEWQASVVNRNQGRGCPFCSGRKAGEDNSLQRLNPQLAAEWNRARNGSLRPDQVTPGSGKVVWWRCPAGHEWEARVYSRSRGTGCPFCSGRRPTEDHNLAALNPDLAREWHPVRNGRLTPQAVTPNSSRKVWWRCRKGHEWRAVIHRRNQGGGCPVCREA